MNNKKGVKLLAAIAVLAMMFAGVAVILSDNGDVDAADDITKISGKMTGSQTFVYGNNVVVNDDLTIPKDTTLTIAGATFTVNSGVTVTIEDGGSLELIVGEKPDTHESVLPYVQIKGTVIAEGKNATIFNGVPDYSTESDDTCGLFVSGKIVLNKGAVLYSDRPDVKGNIVVLSSGSVEVNKKNTNASTIQNQIILISENVSFKLSGFIKGVVVEPYTAKEKYYTAGCVIIDNLLNNDDPKNTSDITIKTVVEKNQAKYANDDNKKVTMKNYVLDISGNIRNGDIVAFVYGASIFDGANNNCYYTLDENDKITTTKILPKATVSGDLALDKLGFFYTMINTQLVVNGNVTVAYDKDLKIEDPADTADASEGEPTMIEASKDRIYIGGEIIIKGSVTLDWESIMTPSGEDPYPLSGTITIDGGKMVITNYIDINQMATPDADQAKIIGLYGAYYTVENTTAGTSTTTFLDLKDAISEATKAGVNEVVVYAGYGSESAQTIAEAAELNAYIVEDGTVIPDGMTLVIMNAIYVPEGSSMTFDVGSDVGTSNGGSYHIYVAGKVIDNDNVLDDEILFEVSKYNEDTNVMVYTTLTIALSEATTGEIVTIVHDATISKTVTIGSGITVQVGEEGRESVEMLITLKGELVVNGILNIENGTINVEVERDAESENAIVKSGKITVNNVVMVTLPVSIYEVEAEDDATTNDGQGAATADGPTPFYVAGIYTTGKVGDLECDVFILAPNVAAANSTTLEDMHVLTKTTYSGDLVFVAGEDSDGFDIIIEDTAVFGKITLDGFNIVIDANGVLTATVGADVTGGYSAVKLDKVSSQITLSVVPEDSGEEITTTFVIDTGISPVTLAGNITIIDGEVYLDGDLSVGTYDEDNKNKAILTVGSDANLIVMKDSTLTVVGNKADKPFVGLIVDGTLTIESEGTFKIDKSGISGTTKAGMASINGTLTVKGDQTIDGQLIIVGTLVVDVVDEDAQELTVNGTLTIGKAPKAVGADGTVVGILQVPATGTLMVYPGADMSKAIVNPDAVTGESKAIKTDYVIEGMIYLTVYGDDNSNLFIPIATLEGYQKVTEWYAKEDFSGTALTTTDKMADNPVVYGKAIASTAYIQVSVGTGMSLWVDGVKYTTGDVKVFNVGEYDVEVTINPGYKGTSKILFNGSEITNGKMVVTADMSKTATSATKAIVLSAIGDITIDTGEQPAPVEKDDSGMGITDYLLIVLVVLAAILVVIVAIRMMRS